MKKNFTYRTKEKWGVQNKMQFKKKKMDNSWVPRENNKKYKGRVKKSGYFGYKKKCNINKIGYFKMISQKFIITGRVY